VGYVNPLEGNHYFSWILEFEVPGKNTYFLLVDFSAQDLELRWGTHAEHEPDVLSDGEKGHPPHRNIRKFCTTEN